MKVKKKMSAAVSVVIVILSLLTGCGPRIATSGDLIVPVSAAELTPSPVPTLAPASAETPAALATVVPATVALATPVPAVDTVGTAVAATFTALPTVPKSDTTLASTPTPTFTSVPASMSGTYPALTNDIVGPWIAKMGSGGHPGHDVVGNTQCAYWLSPVYIGFADDTGPNTSGIETSDEGVFTFDLAAIARYKNLPDGTVFVAEAAWAKYRGVEYEQLFLITTGRDTIDLTGAAIFALPNPASVDPFISLRQAHLICRGYDDSIVDFRSGFPVVKYAARVSSDLAPAASASKTPVSVPTSALVASGINATYTFGSLTGSVNKAVCVELKGAKGSLSIELKSGGFAVSGRESEATDWQLAKSSGPGKYSIATWTGWLLCFDANAAQAGASLVATDGNAKSNQRVEWKPVTK